MMLSKGLADGVGYLEEDSYIGCLIIAAKSTDGPTLVW
jgi:hypothetical protein